MPKKEAVAATGDEAALPVCPNHGTVFGVRPPVDGVYTCVVCHITFQPET